MQISFYRCNFFLSISAIRLSRAVLFIATFPKMVNYAQMDDFAPLDIFSSRLFASVPGTERVYFVPYRCLKEARESSIDSMEEEKAVMYVATSSSSYARPMQMITDIFASDLILNLRQGEDLVQAANSGDDISGCDYALVPEDLWLQALKWHNGSDVATRSLRDTSAKDGYGFSDVYPLQLRLSFTKKGNPLTLKINKMDNGVDIYNRACKIFDAECEPIRIWDFSGRTNLYFVNQQNMTPEDSLHQLDQEVLLELQVYGLSGNVDSGSERMNDKLAMQQTKTEVSSFLGSIMSNDMSGSMSSSGVLANPTNLFGSYEGMGFLGLTGLQNLGNTCFMNSAIQCLAHTPKLVEYFLGDYDEEINQENPLGMNGELALAFGDLLRKLWAPGPAPVAPRLFKMTLAQFAPQFSGFNQHDSQELLAFLLDGLHEDLNHVRCKPYIEAKDADGRPDDEVGNEYWMNHLARNDSIIVDLFQGQYKSTVSCPFCSKISVTFDPFMYLSLPLPSTIMRTMTVMVISTDGYSPPSPYTIMVPKNGMFNDLIQALSTACCLRSNESLVVAEIFANRIIRFLEEPFDSLSLIRDDDQLVAYRLRKELDNFPLVVFMHQHMEEHYKIASDGKAFGIPLVTWLFDIASGSDINKTFVNLVNPFLKPREAALDDQENSVSNWNDEDIDIFDATSAPISGGENPSSESEDDACAEIEFEFYLTDEKGITKYSKIEKDQPVLVTEGRQLHLLVLWPDKTISHYDTQLLNSLPQIFKSGLFAKRLQESVSLYACLEAFLKEEPLGPEDMWYCPKCQKHRQATKKLDLWQLPELLVIHLKRFSYSQFMKNKLETFVDFRTYDLDLSSYITSKHGQILNSYTLYAISNHYGGLGGGHYTAYIHHQGDNQWYEFDDSHVFPITEDKIKTSAAYILFYRRIRTSDSNT